MNRSRYICDVHHTISVIQSDTTDTPLINHSQFWDVQVCWAIDISVMNHTWCNRVSRLIETFGLPTWKQLPRPSTLSSFSSLCDKNLVLFTLEEFQLLANPRWKKSECQRTQTVVKYTTEVASEYPIQVPFRDASYRYCFSHHDRENTLDRECYLSNSNLEFWALDACLHRRDCIVK